MATASIRLIGWAGVRVGALVFATGFLAAPAAAQGAWKPAKSIEYINPAAPGGSVDLMIRATKKFADDARLHADVVSNVLYKRGGMESPARTQHVGRRIHEFGSPLEVL